MYLKITLLALFSLFSLSAQAQLLQNAYTLGPGDIINISVYEEADLSFTVRVDDSGTLTYPFIGEIQIIGYTTTQFENSIIRGLIEGEFLIHPEVTVSIEQYRPFYIDGQVQSPGSYPYEPGLTIRKAVTIAGGFTERASRSKITVIRNTPLNANVLEPNEFLDTPIGPEDIITVDQRFF